MLEVSVFFSQKSDKVDVSIFWSTKIATFIFYHRCLDTFYYVLGIFSPKIKSLKYFFNCTKVNEMDTYHLHKKKQKKTNNPTK